MGVPAGDTLTDQGVEVVLTHRRGRQEPRGFQEFGTAAQNDTVQVPQAGGRLENSFDEADQPKK